MNAVANKKNKKQYKFPRGHKLTYIDTRIFEKALEISEKNKESIVSIINKQLLSDFGITE